MNRPLLHHVRHAQNIYMQLNCTFNTKRAKNQFLIMNPKMIVWRNKFLDKSRKITVLIENIDFWCLFWMIMILLDCNKNNQFLCWISPRTSPYLFIIVSMVSCFDLCVAPVSSLYSTENFGMQWAAVIIQFWWISVAPQVFPAPPLPEKTVLTMKKPAM